MEWDSQRVETSDYVVPRPGGAPGGGAPGGGRGDDNGGANTNGADGQLQLADAGKRFEAFVQRFSPQGDTTLIYRFER